MQDGCVCAYCVGRHPLSLNIPGTDEDIAEFERQAGPPPPLSEEYIERTTEKILGRIRAEERKRHGSGRHPGKSSGTGKV